MTYYELATLTVTLGGANKAAPGIKAFATDGNAKGRMVGVFASEIGRLNEVYVLREFESENDLLAERERTRRAANPFGAGDVLVGLTLDSYRKFDFLPPVDVDIVGPFYEIRTYEIKRDGLEQTLSAWKAAVPVRTSRSPLVVAMYGIDGHNRFVNIWSYGSLNERQGVRSQAVADGIWPPKNGPAALTQNMTSTIALPLAVSPLQ